MAKNKSPFTARDHCSVHVVAMGASVPATSRKWESRSKEKKEKKKREEKRKEVGVRRDSGRKDRKQRRRTD